MLDILYEDNHLIAINKPAGILVQNDNTGDEPLVDLVKKCIKERDKKPGNVFIGLIHRLDRPTSGVVILAKTSKALHRMNLIFRDRKIEKCYWAIVENEPPKNSDRLIHYLKKNQKNNKVTVFANETAGAKKAVSEYLYLKKLDYYHLLEVQIFTGRTHQIRSQLAFIGCSIKGDLKYGAKRSSPDKSICLHARSVKFIHPVKNEEIEIVAPTPNNNIWDDCI